MAKTVKHGLGRGLGALMGEAIAETAAPAAPQGQAVQPAPGDQVAEIALTQIDPNQDQPRRRFDAAALEELAQSIRSVGVIQPIILQKKGDRYQIIAGERRFRAARMAGLKTIPAILREWDEIKRMEVALIENLQRDDLNPLDEAQGIKALMDQCGYTQEAAAQRLGRSRPAIANLLRILSLPEKIQDMVRDGRLSAGHARCLAAISDESQQLRLANLCIAQGWSVRQMEKICQQTLKGAPEKEEKAPRPQEFKELERMARDAFGTRASIEGDMNRGKLVLNYYSQEDLQRIWDVLECVGQNNL